MVVMSYRNSVSVTKASRLILFGEITVVGLRIIRRIIRMHLCEQEKGFVTLSKVYVVFTVF